MLNRGLLLTLLAGGLAQACARPPVTPYDAGPPKCGPQDQPVETACHCLAKTDCLAADPAHRWSCTPAHACLRVCASNDECAGGNTDTPVCEDLVCKPLACGDDRECDPGKKCLGGSCQAPVSAADVGSCVVAPAHAVLNAGGTASFRILTQDWNGQPITYDGAVQWRSTGLTAIESDTGIDAVFSAPRTASAATGVVIATVGSVQCATAIVTQYAAATGFRVVVTSALDTSTLAENAPVAGAKVVLAGGATVTTDAQGIASFQSIGSGAHTVSVFAAGYDYTTIVGTTATDLLVPLHPTPNDVTFTGAFASSDFSNADNRNGTWRLGFSGASFGGNLFDLSPNMLLGQANKEMEISLGTGTPYGPFPMPAGFVLGLGAEMFGAVPNAGAWSTIATPGHRALWTLGGNSVIGDWLKALGPRLFGSSTEPPPPTPFLAAWSQSTLEFLAFGDSGVVPALSVAPGRTLQVRADTSPLAFDHGRRIHLDVTTPELPPALDALIVMAGAEDSVQGFVPFGAAMGLDFTNDSGGPADHLTDKPLLGGTQQHLPLRVAPRHDGFETAPWSIITLALPSETMFAPESVLTLAATVTHLPEGLRALQGETTPLDLSRPLLVAPDNAVLDESTRQFSMPVATGVTLHRLDIGPPEQRWSIYFPPNVTSFTVPSPPSGFTDRFPGLVEGSASAGVLHSASLGFPPPGTTAPITYDDVWHFDGLDAAHLSPEVDAFSIRWLPRP